MSGSTYSKEFYQKHREAYIKASAKWNKNNKDKVKEALEKRMEDPEYAEEKKKKDRERFKIYYEKNKEEIRRKNLERYHRKKKENNDNEREE
jgi:hypothetical protein